MPQIVTKKRAQKKSALTTRPTSFTDSKSKKSDRRSSVVRRVKKAEPPRIAPDGIPWPPLARVRGRGNLTAKQIREIVLTAMAEVACETSAKPAGIEKSVRRINKK